MFFSPSLTLQSLLIYSIFLFKCKKKKKLFILNSQAILVLNFFGDTMYPYTCENSIIQDSLLLYEKKKYLLTIKCFIEEKNMSQFL